MAGIITKLRTLILSLIDWFYTPFQKFIPIDTFRYAICGGANTTLDIFLYYVSYNFILKKEVVHVPYVSISPYIAAFMMVFPITFTTGFLLSKYITFTESQLKGRIQFFRYGVNVTVCIVLNYKLIKFFVETLGIYPTLSKVLTTVVVVFYSYFSQKHFSFKTDKNIVKEIC